jgi:hypothetical protein
LKSIKSHFSSLQLSTNGFVSDLASDTPLTYYAPGAGGGGMQDRDVEGGHEYYSGCTPHPYHSRPHSHSQPSPGAVDAAEVPWYYAAAGENKFSTPHVSRSRAAPIYGGVGRVGGEGVMSRHGGVVEAGGGDTRMVPVRGLQTISDYFLLSGIKQAPGGSSGGSDI